MSPMDLQICRTAIPIRGTVNELMWVLPVQTQGGRLPVT